MIFQLLGVCSELLQFVQQQMLGQECAVAGLSAEQVVDSFERAARLFCRHCEQKAQRGLSLCEYAKFAELQGAQLVRFMAAPIHALYRVAHIAKQVIPATEEHSQLC